MAGPSGNDQHSSDPPPPQSSTQRADELLGTVVAGRYRINEVIAMGAMGAVYRAEHVHMRKRMALKLLHPETEGLPELVKRFERESIVGAHANHPNVATATDFGKLEDGSYYLTQEYIEGITLYTLRRRGPIPVERAVDIGKQIAEGLHAIHKLGIVHRDLKPRNVMVSEKPPDLVKLIDFGFAKLPLERFEDGPTSTKLTSKGVLFGTVGFMAPEVTFGMHAVGPAADLYALGVMLYEMFTGKHPYPNKETKALFRSHQLHPPPRFSERAAPEREIPPGLETVTLKLLEKDPDDRYADAADVIEALDAAMRGELPGPDEAASSEPPEESPAPTPVDVGGVPMKRSGLAWLFLFGVVTVFAAVMVLKPDVRQRMVQLVRGEEQKAPAPAKATSQASATAAPTPSPTLSASTPPAASASAPKPRPTAIDGMDANSWRKVLRATAMVSDASRGIEALVALATIDPQRFEKRTVQHDAAKIAVAASMGAAERADEVFELLTSDQLGSGGPDVLYQMATVHGGSKGAKRAAELLTKDEVIARASPALRIALELRAAPCKERGKLLDRAAKEGDDRALVLLQAMRPPSCDVGGGCCLHYHPKYPPTVVELGRKVGTRP